MYIHVYYIYIESKMAKHLISCRWLFEKSETSFLHDAFSQCFNCFFSQFVNIRIYFLYFILQWVKYWTL